MLHTLPRSSASSCRAAVRRQENSAAAQRGRARRRATALQAGIAAGGRCCQLALAGGLAPLPLQRRRAGVARRGPPARLLEQGVTHRQQLCARCRCAGVVLVLSAEPLLHRNGARRAARHLYAVLSLGPKSARDAGRPKWAAVCRSRLQPAAVGRSRSKSDRTRAKLSKSMLPIGLCGCLEQDKGGGSMLHSHSPRMMPQMSPSAFCAEARERA